VKIFFGTFSVAEKLLSASQIIILKTFYMGNLNQWQFKKIFCLLTRRKSRIMSPVGADPLFRLKGEILFFELAQ
jgi:hypothetical protein